MLPGDIGQWDCVAHAKPSSVRSIVRPKPCDHGWLGEQRNGCEPTVRPPPSTWPSWPSVRSITPSSTRQPHATTCRRFSTFARLHGIVVLTGESIRGRSTAGNRTPGTRVVRRGRAWCSARQSCREAPNARLASCPSSLHRVRLLRRLVPRKVPRRPGARSSGRRRGGRVDVPLGTAQGVSTGPTRSPPEATDFVRRAVASCHEPPRRASCRSSASTRPTACTSPRRSSYAPFSIPSASSAPRRSGGRGPALLRRPCSSPPVRLDPPSDRRGRHPAYRPYAIGGRPCAARNAPAVPNTARRAVPASSVRQRR